MADMDYFGADYGAEPPSRVMDAMRNFGLVNWAGAATSLALTAGMAVWAVNLTFGDVSAVPVIRAIEGPMRVAPDDPGGTNMPYQGLALADITSGGAASPSPEEIVLAPPPVSLEAPSLAERIEAAEAMDAAVPEAPAEVPEGSADVAVAMTDAGDDSADVEVIEVFESADDPIDVEAEALVAKLASLTVPAPEDGVEGVTLVSADGTEAAEPETGPKTIEVAGTLERGLSRSTRPAARPAALRAVARAAAPATSPIAAPAAEPGTQVASAAPVRDADPASIVAGTRVVQLGAFDSEAIARAEWDRLQGRFGDYLAGHSPMVQKWQSGGRDFWRLRVVGFEDSADARRLCTALLAQQQACIPVTVR